MFICTCMYTYVYVYGQRTTDSAGHTIFLHQSIHVKVVRLPATVGSVYQVKTYAMDRMTVGMAQTKRDAVCVVPVPSPSLCYYSCPLTWMLILFHSDCPPTLSSW